MGKEKKNKEDKKADKKAEKKAKKAEKKAKKKAQDEEFEEEESEKKKSKPKVFKPRQLSPNEEAEEYKAILHETGFEAHTVERLRLRFKELDSAKKGYLTTEDFNRIGGLKVNPIGDRLIALFTRNQGGCEFNQFVRTLAVFLNPYVIPPVGERHAGNSNLMKIKTLFRMYDSSGDKQIGMKELNHMLRSMVGSKIGEDTITAIAYRTMIDTNTITKDLEIQFKDFKRMLQPEDVGARMTYGFHYW